MAQNYGLEFVWPNLTKKDIQNLQGITSIAYGQSDPNKGYNEFELYGEKTYFSLPDLRQNFYYLYTGFSWYNPNLDRPVTDAGQGFGVFI